MRKQSNCIQITNVNKKHGHKEILRNITFEAKPGRVTAFLGPNGAGKSSTLRILLGLDNPASGTATFSGQKYSQLTFPLHKVGAVFDGIGGVNYRKVETHLNMIAMSNNIKISKVQEVLEIVEMASKRNSRLGTLSLGEGQRVGLAAAMLGDPQFLVLDEPMNGLDPSGIRWMRVFIRKQAESGKTILLSSHLLSEIEVVADDIIIINHGQILANGTLSDVMQSLESLEDVFFALTDKEALV